MGKGSTQIQRDIERKRYTLSQRIAELDRRIREDLDKTRSEAQSRIQSVGDRAKGRAKGPAEKAKDRAAGIREQAGSLNERIGESPVGQHPNLLLAGSFAAGVALGMATGGGGDDRYEEEREEPPAWFREYAALRQESFAPQRPGRLDRSIDSVVSGIRGELLALLRDFIDRAMDKRSEASEDGSGGIPTFVRSAWDNISSRIEPDRPPRPVGARSASKSEAHVEMRERDLPQDRPLSDLEERTAEDMGVER